MSKYTRDDLERMLARSEGREGYNDRVNAIKEAIAAMDKEEDDGTVE